MIPKSLLPVEDFPVESRLYIGDRTSRTVAMQQCCCVDSSNSMPTHLDILAIEPFYGGARRQMLQTMMRLSRHHWTLLKLPARRVERRLAASARWFAELVGRLEMARVDLLFTSEMMNLTELQRMVPRLGRRPSIVYFHDNQTPLLEQETTGPLDLINLNNAMASTEIWFNSQYHQDNFLHKTSVMVGRIPEIAGSSPVMELRGKSRVIPPPVDLGRIVAASNTGPLVYRDARTLFVDLRDADVNLLLEVLWRLETRGEHFNLITVGADKDLPRGLRRTKLHERDEIGQYRAMREASIYLGLRYGATTDELIVPALSAECWPVVPDAGLYAELVPPMLHMSCLHDGSAESMVARILDSWYVDRPLGYETEQQDIVARRDAIDSCHMIDDLLEEVAMRRTVRA